MTPIEKKSLCAWVADRIEPYLDGELSADESHVFDRHVDACVDCREELTFAETVLSKLRELPAQSCPDRVTGPLYTSVETGPKLSVVQAVPVRRWPGGWFLRPAVAGMLAVIVFATMILVGRMERGTNEATPDEVARATAEVQWTLAYVGNVSRWTGRTFQQEVLEERVVAPVRRAVHSAIEGSFPPHNPTETNGGSL